MKASIVFTENLLSRPDNASGIILREAIEVIKAVFPVPRNHRGDLPYAVRDLSRLLTQERGALHQSYWSAPRFVAAYTHFFLPWNLYRLSWLLPSLRLSLPAQGHVVDLGSGPLTLPLALWCFCPELRAVPLRFTCFDVAMRPMEIGRDILRELAGEGNPWEITLARKPLDAALGSLTAPVHLMTAGNVLNELPPPRHGALEDRLAELMAVMHRKLAPGGRLLLVEPGNRLGGKVIAMARKGAIGRGFAPLAPCPHAGPCPMIEQQLYYPPSPPYSGWCHFIYPAVDAPELLTSLGKQANLEKESLALSCLLLQKGAEEARVVPAQEASSRAPGGMDDLDDLEALYHEIMDDGDEGAAPRHASVHGQARGYSAAHGQAHAQRPTFSPEPGETLPDLHDARRMYVRVISDYIRLPHEVEPARYGCSPKGLVLVRDAVRVPSGGAVAVSLPGGDAGQAGRPVSGNAGQADRPATAGGVSGQGAAQAPGAPAPSPASLEERDAKSGALMVDREGYRPGTGGPSPASRQPRDTSGTPREHSKPAREEARQPRETSGKPREHSKPAREEARQPREALRPSREASRPSHETSRPPREASGKARDTSAPSGPERQPVREERPARSKAERDAKRPPRPQGQKVPRTQGQKGPRGQGSGSSRSGGRGR